MNDISNPEEMAKNIVKPGENFKGFTLEEIRYQRALIALQAEFCKTKVLKNISNLQKINPLSPTSAASSLPGKVGAVALKLINGLNYVDYAILGFSLFNSARKVFSFFHKKK